MVDELQEAYLAQFDKWAGEMRKVLANQKFTNSSWSRLTDMKSRLDSIIDRIIRTNQVRKDFSESQK